MINKGCKKIEVVLGALRLGYDVIFSDVDIVFTQDPISYLFPKGVHYAHSSNKGCGNQWDFYEEMEGNTGFYAVRSSNISILVWDLTYKACVRQRLYDDQYVFWQIIRNAQLPLFVTAPLFDCNQHSIASIVDQNSTFSQNLTASTFISCPLDGCLFSAGNLKDSNAVDLLKKGLKKLGQNAVMIHANWIIGSTSKHIALKSQDLWASQKGSGSTPYTCAFRPAGQFFSPLQKWQQQKTKSKS